MTTAYCSNRFLGAVLALIVALFPTGAFAACANPSGVEGEIVYNTTHKVAQFCNGTNWISMAAGSGGSDPDTLATLACSANEIPKWSGSAWACAADDGGGSATAAGSVAGAVQFNDGSDAFAADDTNLVWDNTNKRLGIGTTSPGARLTVGDVTTGNGDVVINRQNTSGNEGGELRFAPGTSGDDDFYIDSYGSGTSEILRLRSSSSPSILNLSKSGNVGIGTATPSTRLEVAYNAPSGIKSTGSSTSSIGVGLANTISGGNSWGLYSAGSAGPAPLGSFGLWDDNAGVTRLTVLNNGNVGIGTTTPSHKLDVTGLVQANGLSPAFSQPA